MKTSIKYVLVALLVGAGWWFFNNTETAPSAQNSELAHVLNECDVITEKAAADLVAIVEFQKLEIAGRKANVFKTCMKDRAYHENPAWTKYATPLATQKAKNENTSVDEAFENLRRVNMVVAQPSQDKPWFWIQTAH